MCLLVLGRKIGLKDIEKGTTKATMGITQVEGAIFTLLGLLVAFSFYGAYQRYEARREIIVNETNAIGTAWLRVDLLPKEVQAPVRELFTKYTDARLNVNHLLPNIAASNEQSAKASKLQDQIWDLAITASKQSSSPYVMMLFIPSLNSMFDIATTHNVTLITHPPYHVYQTLVFLMCISSFFVGYGLSGSKKTNWLHGIGYTITMVGVLLVIVDFEFPRIGLINIKSFDQPMISLLEKMNSFKTHE